MPGHVPVAVSKGDYEADEQTLKRHLEGRVLYRYCSAEGTVDEDANINGAANSAPAASTSAAMCSA